MAYTLHILKNKKTSIALIAFIIDLFFLFFLTIFENMALKNYLRVYTERTQ
jgi:hypothetical protein